MAILSCFFVGILSRRRLALRIPMDDVHLERKSLWPTPHICLFVLIVHGRLSLPPPPPPSRNGRWQSVRILVDPYGCLDVRMI